MNRQQRIQQRFEEFREFCRLNNHVVLPGNRVREEVAALIIGISAGTLRNWRSNRKPGLRFCDRGRVTYELAFLAEFLDGE